MADASSLRSSFAAVLARPLTSLVLTLIFHLLLRSVLTVDDVGFLLNLTLTLTCKESWFEYWMFVPYFP